MSDRVPGDVTLARLAPEDLIVADAVIGAYPVTAAGLPDAMAIPSKRRLFHDVALMAVPPGGNQVGDEALISQVTTELSARLGGWFANELDGMVELYDSLASADLKARIGRGGMTVAWDEPASAYYWLAARADDWVIQAVGDASAFHCVSLGHPIPGSVAIGPGGHPQRRPLGDVAEILSIAAPLVSAFTLTDRSSEQATNVYDTYLEDPGTVVRAGVRCRLDRDGREVETSPYLYAIRIDIGTEGPANRAPGPMPIDQ